MIDWQRIRDLKQEIGAGSFDKVVVLFLGEADAATDQLLAATTPPDMKRDLHALKGLALNLGFVDLAQLCQIYETRAAEGDTDLPLAKFQTVYAASRTEFLSNLAAVLRDEP